MEPWQMTRDEYIASQKGKRFKKDGYYNRKGALGKEHEDIVSNAIQKGYEVPERVYSEYPYAVKNFGFDKRYDAFRKKHYWQIYRNNPIVKSLRSKTMKAYKPPSGQNVSHLNGFDNISKADEFYKKYGAKMKMIGERITFIMPKYNRQHHYELRSSRMPLPTDKHGWNFRGEGFWDKYSTLQNPISKRARYKHKTSKFIRLVRYKKIGKSSKMIHKRRKNRGRK